MNFINNALPTIKTAKAQDPDRLIPPFGLFSARSKKDFSAAAKPLNKASFGFQGKLGSLIT